VLRTVRIEDFAVVSDVSVLDGGGAVVMSHILNGFAEVLPAVASALVAAPVK
jgi:hypothetical protein